MPKNRKANSKVQQLEKVVNDKETIIVFRALKKLTDIEHEQLSGKIRFEEEKSGVKIVLMPYSCEFVVDTEGVDSEEIDKTVETSEETKTNSTDTSNELELDKDKTEVEENKENQEATSQ
jgi:hypothetical protein